MCFFGNGKAVTKPGLLFRMLYTHELKEGFDLINSEISFDICIAIQNEFSVFN